MSRKLEVMEFSTRTKEMLRVIIAITHVDCVVKVSLNYQAYENV